MTHDLQNTHSARALLIERVPCELWVVSQNGRKNRLTGRYPLRRTGTHESSPGTYH